VLEIGEFSTESVNCTMYCTVCKFGMVNDIVLIGLDLIAWMTLNLLVLDLFTELALES